MPPVAALPFPQCLLAGLAVLVGCGLLFADTPCRPTAEQEALTVVYVGAEDCGPCRAWRRDERPSFLDSREFPTLHYREVIAPRLRDLLAEEQWPAGLAELRAQVRQRPGAPQWFVLRGSEVVAWEAGASAWRRAIWPAIRAHAGRSCKANRQTSGMT
jgi:hypothetical protein